MKGGRKGGGGREREGGREEERGKELYLFKREANTDCEGKLTKD